jgi:signal transduction histidine kinase
LFCRADPIDLEAVLLDLCRNAAEACRSGGAITLSAERAGPEAVAAAGLPAGDYARLEVADTGVGMAPDVLAQATRAYFTTRADRGGSGLGLHSALCFAQAAGGALRIASAPGRGTQVSLYLPLAQPPRGPGAPVDAEGAPA